MSAYSSVASADSSNLPVATQKAEMVEVISPGTLSAGYTFQASYNGVIFPVTVPPGGVTEGERIIVPFTNETTSELTPLAAIDTAPHGHWKDGLCDCCKYGPFHPALCNAIFCPQILMGQVLTRMRMSWLGSPANEYDWHMTFRRIAIIVIVYYVLSLILQPDSTEIFTAEDGTVTIVRHEGPLWKSIIYNVMSLCFGLYTIIVMIRLRASVREKYEITPKRCARMEDCLCVFFCSCCTVSQMARQTANYEEIRAVCCTDTGLPPSMQTIIV